jgi:CRP-like cAMP-binding protein
MAIQAAVNAHPTIEERLMLTLAHLGERMGRVTRDGVLLELPLSHRLLAQCVQALRPSVTAGLLRLREDGRLLQPRRGQWLITQAGLNDVAQLCRQEVVVC